MELIIIKKYPINFDIFIDYFFYFFDYYFINNKIINIDVMVEYLNIFQWI